MWQKVMPIQQSFGHPYMIAACESSHATAITAIVPLGVRRAAFMIIGIVFALQVSKSIYSAMYKK